MPIKCVGVVVQKNWDVLVGKKICNKLVVGNSSASSVHEVSYFGVSALCNVVFDDLEMRAREESRNSKQNLDRCHYGDFII